MLVARAHDDPALLREPEGFGSGTGELPGDLGGRGDGGQQRGVDACRLAQPRVVVAGAQVVEQGGRGVRRVLEERAGEPGEEIAAHRQQLAGEAPDVRVVVTQPHHLRGAVGGIGVQPGALEQRLLADGLREGVGLCGGAAVQPDDRVPQRLQPLVHRHHAVDLAGQAEVGDLGRPDSGGVEHRVHRRAESPQPLGRILLRPAGLRVVHGARRSRGGDRRAVRVDAVLPSRSATRRRRRSCGPARSARVQERRGRR